METSNKQGEHRLLPVPSLRKIAGQPAVSESDHDVAESGVVVQGWRRRRGGLGRRKVMSRYEPRRVAAAAACVSQSVLDRARMAMAARLDIADTLSIHDELLFDLGHHIFLFL